MSNERTNLILRSELGADAILRLRLREEPLAALAEGEVRIRLEAAPVNPSDMGLLLASADLSTARLMGEGKDAEMSAELIGRRLGPFERRVGLSLPVGNEGTGTVVEAAADVRHMAICSDPRSSKGSCRRRRATSICYASTPRNEVHEKPA